MMIDTLAYELSLLSDVEFFGLVMIILFVGLIFGRLVEGVIDFVFEDVKEVDAE